MSKTAFLFSGQGSQYPLMGTELLNLFPDLETIYDTANDILGFDLKKAIIESDAEALSKTEVSQPAIFSVSVLAFEAVRKLSISCDMVAGHSLGEYAAMVCSNMLSLEDGFKVIKARAKAMGECAKHQDGAMCAIIGKDSAEIEQVCADTDGYVVAVNYNSPVQTVIAGEKAAVDKASAKLAELGARAMPLNVSAAFHSKLMQSAADEFFDSIKDIKFNAPSCDFYSNLYGKKLDDFSDMPSYLSKHIVSPVYFVSELNEMLKDGACRFIECGPNKVLTGLVRKTLKDVDYFNVENEKTYSKLKDSL